MVFIRNVAKYILLRFGLAKIKVCSDIERLSLLKSLLPISQNFELIRVGGDSDGGYLVPNILHSIDYCFSPGVAQSSEFEFFMAKLGIKSFMIDASVDSPTITHELFNFQRLYLGHRTKGEFISLDDWIETSANQMKSGILQMDIEGAEYPSLMSVSKNNLLKFAILVIEFHGLNRLYNGDFALIFELTIAKLKENFEIVHLHPNNAGRTHKIGHLKVPNVVELTLLRKDLCNKISESATLPHFLDRPNRIDLVDIHFPDL